MTPAKADSASLFQRLRGRPDSEHEMSFNRVAFALFALGVTLFGQLNQAAIPFLIAFCAISVAVFVQLLVGTAANRARRILMMVVDFAMILSFMALSDAASAGFWPLLLWTSLGNGFRFGRGFLFAATAISALGFAVVIAVTPFWRAQLPLAIGLMLGLVAIPVYAGQLIRKLSKATATAEEASRAKSYFLASVSHELRTPLTAIIGLGTHLAETGAEAEQRATAGTIVTAGRQLLAMINQLLDFSRLEARGGEAEMEPFDLARLLASVRELMLHQAEDKGLTLNLHLAADAPRLLRGDEARLRDILVNLVGNALKFTEQGAITISAAVEPDARGGHILRLTVADTGIGIAEEAQGRIFGSFAQADDTIIDRYGGTGLGLAICQQLVALMQGEIGVESRPGEGSRFWLTARVEVDAQPLVKPVAARLLLYSDDVALADAIGRGVIRRDTREGLRALYDRSVTTVLLIDARLLARSGLAPDDYPDGADTLARGAVPVLLADADDPLPSRAVEERTAVMRLPRLPAADLLDRALAIALTLVGQDPAAPADVPEASPVTPRRILVADDNAMNQKVFGMILGKAGHDVTDAADGERALDLMRERTFDVVLMDVNMPVMNGIEATKLYRFAALGQARVPIVAITADASPATAQRCLDAGMDACITKPVDSGALIALIDGLTHRPETASAPAERFDPAGVVTPLFRAAAPAESPIDWSSIDELEQLGGREFVAELLEVYARDAATLMVEARAALYANDVAAFRSTCHAMCSSAANVGARRVADLCRHLQRIGEAEFCDRGAWQCERLEEALRLAEAALVSWPIQAARAI